MRSASPQPPAWFRFRNTRQEDIVGAMQEEHAALDEMQATEIRAAKEAALPYMAETIRDLDSRSSSFVTGNIRLWTQPAWDRVKRSHYKRKHPFRYWFFVLFPIFNHAKFP